VRILRPILNTTRRAEIEVDPSKILKGEENDIPLLPNDILFVPRSYTHLFWTTMGQIALPTIPYIIFTLAQ